LLKILSILVNFKVEKIKHLIEVLFAKMTKMMIMRYPSGFKIHQKIKMRKLILKESYQMKTSFALNSVKMCVYLFKIKQTNLMS